MARTYKTLVARIAHDVYNYVKSVSPYDTGNLREDSILIIRQNRNRYDIVIWGDMAPYAVFTNEKWISPRWKGKKNPNEKWIDMAAQYVAANIIPRHLNSFGAIFHDYANREEEIARWENKNYYG